MRLDQYGNPIYNSRDVFNLLYQGKIEHLGHFIYDRDFELSQLEAVANIQLIDHQKNDSSIEDYDKQSQNQWFMPDEYKNLDIEEYILSLLEPWDSANLRVLEELEEFKNRNLLDLLRWLKFFVDYSKKHNIVRGVGRGSSVASYILYLLEVHYVDSIKFNLDWHDFLR